MTNSESAQALRRSWEHPYGSAEQISLLRQAVESARESNNHVEEFVALLALIKSAENGGLVETVVTTFVTALALADAHPQDLPLEGVHGNLLWTYKWVIWHLVRTPAVGLDQIEAAVADMRERYLRNGDGVHAVLTTTREFALYSGRLEEAARIREQILVTPRDRQSDCAACVEAIHIDHLVQTGEMEQAIARTESMLGRKMRCQDEPGHTLSLTLISLLRLGKRSQARKWQETSLRLIRRQPGALAIAARHMTYYVAVDEPAEALRLLESWAHYLGDEQMDEFGRFHFLAASGLTLGAVTAAGAGPTRVAGIADKSTQRAIGIVAGQSSASEVAELCWAAADTIALAFDRRNGNSWYAGLLTGYRAIADESFPA